MTDKGTIKIDREDFERHNDRRKDLGLTWSEYIDGEAPEYVREDTAREVVAVLRDELGIEGDADLPNIIRGELDTDHDFDALAREVAARIDYAMLASKVADELEGRIR